MTKSNEDLGSKVSAWLGRNGYSTEMTAARAFRERGFRVNQSYFFEDPKTSEWREVDLLVTRQGDIDGRLIRVVFVIECKWSREKPWVVFSDSSIRLGDSARIRHQATSSHGRKLLAAFDNDPLLMKTGLFASSERLGYSVTTALQDGKGKDLAYAAIAAVSSATNSIASRLQKAPIASILFSIVILDGRLYDCHMGNDHNIKVEEQESAVLLWSNPVVSKPHTIIHIVTLDALESLVDDADRTAHALLGLDAQRVGVALGRPAGQVRADDPSIDF